MNISSPFWADSADRAIKVRDACMRAFDRGEAIGLDTEFYNVEVGKQSTCGRARLHFLSVAVKRFPAVVLPRGHHLSDPAVVSQGCLSSLSDVFRAPGLKAVHNLPVDAHTLANEGYELNGGVNTLAMARWAWPVRARHEGFTLDSLATDLLGVGKTEQFKALFRESRTEYRSTFRQTQVCECGVRACGFRRTTPGHSRHVELVETKHPREVEYAVPLESVVPGHVLFERALDYSARDAVLALGVYDLAIMEMNRQRRDMPW